ncbi:adenosylcobinamide-GDP ribazoletransferase [Nitrosomonas sp.]|uniref:adenosylcobinamide-GDP ribazoletransferase n=1 Tax=Nitrosomonas sp. TaxID=42353 RepID=UPI002B26836C|nr:adenosylcobinamide-GDP ribazoletransferase [Nitrosomonas sp.]
MLKQEWRSLLLAIGFFTRIPVPALPDFQEQELNLAAKYFPLVGIIVGAFAAIVYMLAGKVLPQDIAVLLSMVATLWLTGAFHEDGLTDAIDGLGGGWEKEHVLQIMQDSRIGSYGAVSIVMALLLKFTALTHFTPALIPVLLIAGHSLSRFCAVMVMATQCYVKYSGKSKPIATRISPVHLGVAALFGLLPLLWLPSSWYWGMVPVMIVWVWFSLILNKRIGGYTGDCLGAMQQLTEIAFYLGVLACFAI